MELFDLKNLITGATCFKKGCTPSQNDVILSNVSARCMKSLNFPTGISDCHNFISTVINSNIAKDEMSKFEYRSFSGFDHDKFLSDLQRIDFHLTGLLNLMQIQCMSNLKQSFPT